MQIRRSMSLLAVVLLSTGCGNPVEEIKSTSSSAVTAAGPISVAEGDWPWWRGPTRNGIAETQDVPTDFSDARNVIWSAEIPGRGHSSATIVGEGVYLATADEQRQTQSMLGMSRATGELLWTTEVHSGGFPGASRMHAKSSHASCTLASDGETLYGAFLNHDKIHVSAVDLAGNVVWKREVGPFSAKFGFAPSPCLYQGAVIVAADNEGGGYLAAVQREDGEIIWRIRRSNVSTYASPVVANVGGRDQLLICGGRTVDSYDPVTGNQLWSVPGTADSTVGTLVWDGDLVFASGGYSQNETVCVDAGTGEVVWRDRNSLYVPSLLAHGGYLYGVDDKGIARCWEAANGAVKWKGRLCGANSSSPVLAGDNIFVCDERGTVAIFKANPERLEITAKNRVADEFFASPVIADDRIFLRGARRDGGKRREILFCIGKPPEAL